MTSKSTEQLQSAKCVPCEGGVPKLTLEQAQEQIQQTPGWEIVKEGERIKKSWQFKNFVAGMDFLNKVAEISEAEAHHPDVHLESYRNVWIEIWTHAIGGLSENDFILAAKIDQIEL